MIPDGFASEPGHCQLEDGCLAAMLDFAEKPPLGFAEPGRQAGIETAEGSRSRGGTHNPIVTVGEKVVKQALPCSISTRPPISLNWSTRDGERSPLC